MSTGRSLAVPWSSPHAEGRYRCRFARAFGTTRSRPLPVGVSPAAGASEWTYGRHAQLLAGAANPPELDPTESYSWSATGKCEAEVRTPCMTRRRQRNETTPATNTSARASLMTLQTRTSVTLQAAALGRRSSAELLAGAAAPWTTGGATVSSLEQRSSQRSVVSASPGTEAQRARCRRPQRSARRARCLYFTQQVSLVVGRRFQRTPRWATTKIYDTTRQLTAG